MQNNRFVNFSTKHDVINFIYQSTWTSPKYFIFEILKRPSIFFPHNTNSSTWRCKTTIANHALFIDSIIHDTSFLQDGEWMQLIQRLNYFININLDKVLISKSIRQKFFFEDNFKKFKSFNGNDYRKNYISEITWVDNLSIQINLSNYGVVNQEMEVIGLLLNQWNEIISNDHLFDWYTQGEIKEKLAATEKYFRTYKKTLLREISCINNLELAKVAFDRMGSDLSEKRLTILKIQKTKSNKKTNEKIKKNQLNLNVSEHHKSMIKKLSENLKKPQARVVEIIIDHYLNSFSFENMSDNISEQAFNAETPPLQNTIFLQNPPPLGAMGTPNLMPPIQPMITPQDQSFINLARQHSIKPIIDFPSNNNHDKQ